MMTQTFVAHVLIMANYKQLCVNGSCDSPALLTGGRGCEYSDVRSTYHTVLLSSHL